MRSATVTTESIAAVQRGWFSAWAHHVVARVAGRGGWGLVVFERRLVR